MVTFLLILILTGGALCFLILNDKLTDIMANQQDIEQEIQAIKRDVADVGAKVTAKIAELQAKIDAGASGPDLAPQLAELNDIAASISAIGT